MTLCRLIESFELLAKKTASHDVPTLFFSLVFRYQDGSGGLHERAFSRWKWSKGIG